MVRVPVRSAMTGAYRGSGGAVLALVAAEGTLLDAGSVGLALSRRWSDAGDPVLFVDADTSGSRLAERFGEAVRAGVLAGGAGHGVADRGPGAAHASAVG